MPGSILSTGETANKTGRHLYAVEPVYRWGDRQETEMNNVLCQVIINTEEKTNQGIGSDDVSGYWLEASEK